MATNYRPRPKTDQTPANKPYTLDDLIYSDVAERAVIGGLLINPDMYHAVSQYISAEDFFTPRHSYVYRAINALVEAGGEVDNITVSDQLKQMGVLVDTGGDAYLVELLNGVPSSQHVTQYAQIVQRYAVRRMVQALSKRFMQLASDPTLDVESLLGSLGEAVDATTTKMQAHGAQPIGNRLGGLLDRLESARDGNDGLSFPTGLDDLDAVIGGYRRNKVYIIGGRTHNGKSSLIYTSALAAAKRGYKVGIYNTADGDEQTVMLMLMAIEAGLSPSAMEMGNLSDAEYAHMIACAGRIAKLPIYIKSDKTMTPKQMLSHAKSVKFTNGLDICFVDYLQSMAGPPQMKDYERISTISKSLTKIASQLDVALVAAAQINRAGGTGKAPELRHLEGSGKMEQDCQVGIIVHMDGLYNADCPHPDRMTLVVEKNKVTGQTGVVYARQNRVSTGLTNWEGETNAGKVPAGRGTTFVQRTTQDWDA